MLLREFIYFDDKHVDPIQDNRYLSQNDTSILRKSDLRKSRLTLRMLNDLRLASEAQTQERLEELSLIRQMYALPPPGTEPM